MAYSDIFATLIEVTFFLRCTIDPRYNIDLELAYTVLTFTSDVVVNKSVRDTLQRHQDFI